MMEVQNFKLINKGSIKARFDINFPKLGFAVREFTLIQSEGKAPWVSSPARQFQDGEGKKKYYSYFILADAKKESFQNKVIELIKPLLQQEINAASVGNNFSEDVPF